MNLSTIAAPAAANTPVKAGLLLCRTPTYRYKRMAVYLKAILLQAEERFRVANEFMGELRIII